VVATDSDGVIIRAELYKGTELIQSGVTAPFTFTFTPTTVGVDFLYYAQAYDNTGAFTRSSGAPLTVTASANTVQGEKPTLTFSDSENWLKFASIYGDSAILVSPGNGPYVAYTSVPGYNASTNRIDTGDVDRIDGYWKAKVKADTNRTESVITPSPAFTKAATTTPPDTTPPVPVVYDVNLLDSQTDATTLTRLTTDGTANVVLRYNRPTAGDTSPLDMSIFIGTENVALANSVSYLSGTTYSFDYAGHTYSGTFVNGNSTATFVK
jgi:hypothetical protein